MVLDLAISLGGIAFLVGLILWLFPSGAAALTKEAAAERLAFDEPDFTPQDWAIDAAGRGGLAIDAHEAALIRRNGADLATRRVRTNKLNASNEGAVLILSLDDPTFPPLRLTLASNEAAADWCRRLSA